MHIYNILINKIMSEPEKKIETSPNYAKIYLLKCQNLEKTINLQKKEIQKLNTELLKANKDKQELKMFIQTNSTLKDQVQNLKLELQNTREEYIEIIKKKDNELSKLTRDLSTLESKMLIDKSAFDKNTDIYRLKMSTLTYLQMDNKAYQEEIAVLQKQQEDYKVKVEEEMKNEKKNNILKIEKFRQKMINDLNKTNDDIKKFNYAFTGANNKLLQLQNQQLLAQIDKMKNVINDLHKEIKLLKSKIDENKKDMDIHKLVEYNLAQKLIEKNQNIKNKKSLLFNSSQTSLPTLKKTQSENDIFSNSNYKNYNDKKIFNNIDINSRNSNLNNSNNININMNMNLNLNNNKRSNSTEDVESFNHTQKLNLKFGKKYYQKEILEKNVEIEKEKLINVQLRNKLNVYKIKFKGLVDFLEENLQNFSKDEKIMAKTNFNSKSEKIRKCEFDEFNNEEKKELLSILIKYLLPLANPDMDYNGNNDSRTYFNTNLSITKLKNINNRMYLNDNILKKAFVDKTSKYHKDILSERTLIFNSSKHELIDE